MERKQAAQATSTTVATARHGHAERIDATSCRVTDGWDGRHVCRQKGKDRVTAKGGGRVCLPELGTSCCSIGVDPTVYTYSTPSGSGVHDVTASLPTSQRRPACSAMVASLRSATSGRGRDSPLSKEKKN